MIGDPGPYLNEEGDVWVPRTVPYREARSIAKTGMEYGDRLRYVGREDALLLGFARDCRCEEVCCGGHDEDGCVPIEDCRVPAWHFRVES